MISLKIRPFHDSKTVWHAICASCFHRQKGHPMKHPSSKANAIKLRFRTIQSKIVLITVVFSLIMGISVSAVSYVIYTRYLRNDLIRSTESNLEFAAKSLDSSFGSLDDLVRWCQNHSSITAFAQSATNNPSVKLEAWEQLNSQYLNTPLSSYIARLLITSGMEEYIQIISASYSTSSNILDIMQTLDYLEESLKGYDYNFSMGLIDDPFRSISPKQVLPMIRPIYHTYSSAVTGCIFMEVSTALFADAFHTYASMEGRDMYLLLPGHAYLLQGDVFVPTSILDQAVPFPVSGLLYETTAVSRSQDSGNRFYYVSRPISIPGWYLVQSISDQELHEQNSTFLILIALIFLVVFFTGIVLNLYLQRLVNQPVRKLTAHMKQIAAGDFSSNPELEWDNEFGQIGRGMNAMAANIVQLMDKRLADEKEKQDYEYRLLQSQINPHFLYNTLNSIKWMATIQNAPGIADMTTALSRLLKNISKGNHTIIPLSEELDLIHDYFTIQKYRYGGAISLDIQVEEETLYQCGIMRFTLQPIVENAIFHGIEPKGDAGLITIHAFRPSEGLVQITVTDNGIGMTAEKAAALLTQEDPQKTNFFRELGIASVHKRIQYTFGSGYGLSVESVPGDHTAMTILLPDRLRSANPSPEKG
ncbi:MAG: sensor histidine kinase [Lachnospiraceae bacterium]|nr:sensor histidine kinase [Lachnospiraceae bacterium]